MKSLSRLAVLSVACAACVLGYVSSASAAVTPVYKGTQTLNGSGFENTNDILVTPTNIYTAGIFGTSTVNFDPGGSDPRTPSDYDAYVTKRTIGGGYVWTKTFGGPAGDRVNKIATDASGNLYLAGIFGGTADFDPGPGVVTRTSTSTVSAFLLKLNSDGEFQWVRTFSASTAGNDVVAYSVVVSGTGVIVTGSFKGTTNFNPTGTDNRTASGGNEDLFLSRWNTDGTYGWTKVVGNNNFSEGMALSAHNGYVYVVGYFAAPSTPINFNPDGSSTSTSTGYDAFVSRWSDTGTYGWTRTVRGSGNDNAYAVFANASGVYIGGDFSGSNANFNSTGSDLFTSAGAESSYLIKYTEAGAYQWGRAWGGAGYDSAWVLGGDEHGVLVGGSFYGANFDLDPTAGSDLRSENGSGSGDFYFARYTTGGTYRWGKAIGSTGADGISSLVTGADGNLYVSGYYAGTANFNPDGSDVRSMQGGSGDGFYANWRDVYPTTPGGLATSTATPSAITLTWNPVSTSTSYGLYRATSPGGPSVLATTTPSSTTTFVDSGLAASTTYYYSILSTLEGVNSPTSTEVAATTMPADLVPPIVSLTAPTGGSLASGTVAVAASSSDDIGVVGVTFYRGSTVIGSEDLSAPYQASLDTTLLADGDHVLVAVARDMGDNRTTSSPVTISVDNTAPVRSGGSPSGALSYGTTQATVSISTDEAASCRYAISAGVAYASMTALATTGGTSHAQPVSGLADGSSYAYYLKCRDAAGNVNVADYPVSFSVGTDTDPPLVSDLRTEALTRSSGVVRWVTSEPATTQLTYGTDASYGTTTTLDTTLVTDHRVFLPNLRTSSSYLVRVYSADALGNLATVSGLTLNTRGATTGTTRPRPTQAIPQAIVAPVVLTTSVPGTGSPVSTSLTRDLFLGSTGPDVLVLQRALNRLGFPVAASGPGSRGQETTFFGQATKAAVIALQKARAILPSAGYVGPLTRAYLNAR